MSHIVEWGGKIRVFDYHWEVDQWMEALNCIDEDREYERLQKEQEQSQSGEDK